MTDSAADTLAALRAEAVKTPFFVDSETIFAVTGEYVATCGAKSSARLIVSLVNASPEIEALIRAAERRLAHDHDDTCGWLVSGADCTCGHDLLRAALDSLSTKLAP